MSFQLSEAEMTGLSRNQNMVCFWERGRGRGRLGGGGWSSRLRFYLVGHAESPMSFERENESTFGNQITMVWKMD